MTTEWPPRLRTEPLNGCMPRARLARQILAECGGIASTRYLRDAIAVHRSEPLTIRQTRDLLRSPQVCKLGAGYYATQDTLYDPVLPWTEGRLLTLESEPIEHVITAILAHYPRGDAAAIRCWLQQEPGRLQLGSGRVRLTPQRWRTP